MSASDWAPDPDSIQVNADPAQVEAAAREAGALVRRWPLAGISSVPGLDPSAAEVFEFPFRSAGLAGLIDMLSDLEWLHVENGVLIVIDAAGARQEIVAAVAGILPGVADRWRSQGPSFEVFLVGVSDVSAVETVLEQKNVELDEFGRLAWARSDIARVPVVVHR